MSALYDAASHEALVGGEWDEQRIRRAIASIVADAETAFVPSRWWPRHPLDDYDFPTRAFKTLWLGAAGTLWALDHLAREGAVELRRDYGDAADALLQAYLDDPDSGAVRPGLMLGDAGVLLAAWRISPSQDKEDRLFELVEANVDNPENELFLGSPGTTLAAIFLLELTGATRWRELVAANIARLWQEWRPDAEHRCHLWVQNRRGRLIRSIGCGHGFASNTSVLLRARHLLGGEQRDELYRRALETASALALREGSLVNWPTSADAYWAEQFSIRVQWCHGAPGLVTSLWDLPRGDEADALLEAAGELVWKAGPLVKGYGLCHGTAGNGCAFLALAERTRSERWAGRARAFAVHALAQYEAREQSRYGLWNGDLGLAFFLWSCLTEWRGMPTVDVL